MRNINLTEGTIWKQILSFALPLLVVNLLQQVYSVSDLIIVGNYGGIDAMAGIGASASLISMIIGLAVGLATGVSIITVQVNSSEDYDSLYKVVHTGYALAFATGIVLSLLGIFLAPAMLRLMGTPADILPYAIQYLRIYFISAVPVVIYNIGAGILRGVGDMRHPFLFLSIGILLNIGLDILFIGVFDWGVAGAAWAYVIAQLVTALLVTYSLARSMTPFRLFLRDISFHRGILSRTLKVGIPAGMQAFIVALSNVFIQTAINKFGKNAVAGFSAATRSDSFVFVLISGLAVAVMTFTGANIGARKVGRVKRGLRQSLVLAFVLVAALSGLIILLRRPIAAAFNPDPDVSAYTVRIMLFLLSMYWIFALTEVMGGAIRGMGNSLFPMVISLICMAGVRLLWILVVLPVWNSLDVVILAYPISWAASLIAYLIYIKVKGGIVPKKLLDEIRREAEEMEMYQQKPKGEDTAIS
ncbi:MAG: MATE family efflux transporter [Clostridiaceae bacterium]|jgi:putative MATE family efflux protein|nr:MATE family efflux transporter [Clostridiaceae bacterium]